MEARRVRMDDNPGIYCAGCETYTKHNAEAHMVECVGCGRVYHKINQWASRDERGNFPANVEFDDPGEWRNLPPTFASSMSVSFAPTVPPPITPLMTFTVGGSTTFHGDEWEDD